jgi:hypothetical protein
MDEVRENFLEGRKDIIKYDNPEPVHHFIVQYMN